MEKLGVEVVVDSTPEKKASVGDLRTCPSCAETLLPEDESNVSRCPKCGTEPFEAR